MLLALCFSRRAIWGYVALVVVLVGRTLRPGMRRREHVLQQRGQQPVLLVDQAGAVIVGHLVVIGHRQRPGRAGLDAQAAADAAQIVDLVHPAVALARGEPRLIGVVGALDVDRVGRAGPGAQLAADALLQAVGVAVELVAAVVARLDRTRLLRILLGDVFFEHRRERHAEPGDAIQEFSHSRSPCSQPPATSVPAGPFLAAAVSGMPMPGSPGRPPSRAVGAALARTSDYCSR